jgi:hypothetical protein
MWRRHSVLRPHVAENVCERKMSAESVCPRDKLHLEETASLSALTLSILFAYGGIVNNVVWILCDFWQICPFDPPTQLINIYKSSIAKQVLAWMTIQVCHLCRPAD